MANSKITWTDKESLVTDPTIAEKNKVTDDNMNEIKSVVNENADQVILSDTEPTSNDNEIWIDTSENATYINQEVNIGPTNVSNTPTWFKIGKNLFNANETDRGYLNVSNGNVVVSNDWKTTWFIAIPVGTDHITIIGNKGSQEGYCFYNSSQAFLSGGSMGTSTTKNIPIPTNAKYFKITVSNDVLTSYAIYFNGETTDTYEAYIPPEIIINDRKIYKKMQVVKGTTNVTTDSIGRFSLYIPDTAIAVNVYCTNTTYFVLERYISTEGLRIFYTKKTDDFSTGLNNTSVDIIYSYIIPE